MRSGPTLLPTFHWGRARYLSWRYRAGRPRLAQCFPWPYLFSPSLWLTSLRCLLSSEQQRKFENIRKVQRKKILVPRQTHKLWWKLMRIILLRHPAQKKEKNNCDAGYATSSPNNTSRQMDMGLVFIFLFSWFCIVINKTIIKQASSVRLAGFQICLDNKINEQWISKNQASFGNSKRITYLIFARF